MPIIDIHDRGEPATIRTDKVIRRIMRDALNCYGDQLEKSAKARKKIGLSDEEEQIIRAHINGDEGFGQGIYSMFQEPGTLTPAKPGDQMDITDQLQQQERDERMAAERKAFEEMCEEIVDGIYNIFSGTESEVDFSVDGMKSHALVLVRAWHTQEREAVYEWVTESFPIEAPACVPELLQRLNEFLLTPDEVVSYTNGVGPWSLDADVYEDTNVRFYFARRDDAKDPIAFTEEADALRRVAWLNREDERAWVAAGNAPPQDAVDESVAS